MLAPVLVAPCCSASCWTVRRPKQFFFLKRAASLVNCLSLRTPRLVLFPPPPLPFSHCSFLVDLEVTAPALCALSVDILKDKGQLPVGEVGKLLQVCVCVFFFPFALVVLRVCDLVGLART